MGKGKGIITVCSVLGPESPQKCAITISDLNIVSNWAVFDQPLIGVKVFLGSQLQVNPASQIKIGEAYFNQMAFINFDGVALMKAVWIIARREVRRGHLPPWSTSVVPHL